MTPVDLASDAMKDAASPPVRRLATVGDAEVRGLAELLIDCVEGGASVSFLHPLSLGKASAFWRRVGDDVAEDEQGIVGTVQLVLDLPENQPHRADVSKMLVHRRARRQGLGAALMRAAEAHARALGRSLLVLDTASADAERLYARLGWRLVGAIPRYALLPNGEPCATSYFYRDLGAQ